MKMDSYKGKLSVIALITDFGTADPYVGIVKGVIAGINPLAQCIDLTHEVPPQDVTTAAFLLASCYTDFPKGTLFLGVVDPGVGSDRKAIALKTQDYTFVGPDNGIFGLVIRKEKRDIVCHEILKLGRHARNISNTFHARDIFAPAAARLSLGYDIETLGPVLSGPCPCKIPRPVVKDNEIIAEVIHIDHFGNLITNLDKSTFPLYHTSDNNVTIQLLGNIVPFVKSYTDVPIGSPLALWGSSDFLEIAVNSGSAERLFNAKKGTSIHLFF